MSREGLLRERGGVRTKGYPARRLPFTADLGGLSAENEIIDVAFVLRTAMIRLLHSSIPSLPDYFSRRACFFDLFHQSSLLSR